MKKLVTICAVVMMTLALAIPAMASLTVVDSINHIYTTGSQAGGDLLYWYMDLQQSVNKTKSEQVTYASNLSFDVTGVGLLSDWRVADYTEIGALSAIVNEPVEDGVDRSGNPVITYPGRQILWDAVVRDTGWMEPRDYGNRRFRGRYDGDPFLNRFFGMSGSTATGVGWDTTEGSISDSVSDARIGAWIVVPEPATLALLGLGAVGLLRKRK